MVNSDRATATSRNLLAESAEIVLHRSGEASAAARALASRWHEQSVLDPQAAEQTALQLEKELANAEPILRQLLARETAIAEQLEALIAEEP